GTPGLPAAALSEHRLGWERLGRSRPVTGQVEFRPRARINIDQDVVVFQLRRPAFPIEVRRIAIGYLDAGAAGKDRVLLRAPAAEPEVFHATDIQQLGRVDGPGEYDDLQVRGIGRDRLVRIVRLRYGAEAGAAEDGIMKDDERLLHSPGFRVVQPLFQLDHLLSVFRPIRVPQRR